MAPSPPRGGRALAGEPQTFLLPITQADAAGNWAALGSGIAVTVDGQTGVLGDLSDLYYLDPQFDYLNNVYLGTADPFCGLNWVGIQLRGYGTPGLFLPNRILLELSRSEVSDLVYCHVVSGALPPGPNYEELIDGFYYSFGNEWLSYYLLPPALAGDDSATTAGGSPVTIDVLQNDSAENGGALSPVIVDGPANGSVQVNEDGTVTYTPPPAFSVPTPSPTRRRTSWSSRSPLRSR